MRRIIIIGCGGLGIETAELIHQINMQKPYKKYDLVGFLDDDEKNIGKEINGNIVIGKVSDIMKFDKDIEVVIAISSGARRKRIAMQIQDYCKLTTLIHPSVYVPESTSIGRGCLIFQNCVISVNVIISEFVIMCPKCGIGHGSTICSFASLMWNVNISGDCMIMSFGYCGTNCTMLQGLVAEPYSTIGAGAVVVNNVKFNTTVKGIPAK